VATWGQVTLLLHTLYDVLDERDDSLDVQLGAGRDRSQVVTVRHVVEGLDDGAWIIVESPVGRLDELDVARALALAETQLVGGLTRRMEFLVVVHAAPLATLDAPDLARPLELVARSADRLERALVGRDEL
jgi:hypothetical protein